MLINVYVFSSLVLKRVAEQLARYIRRLQCTTDTCYSLTYSYFMFNSLHIE